MALATKYTPKEIEDKWYSQWLEHKLFASIPDEREAYTIVIPPPNVTGVLHMGHMLNNTIQDILIRRSRLLGKNACWVPGTDHASIATEAKVVAMLKEKGLSKDEIGRDEFLKYAFEWKENYGGKILNQLQKLGCSCDWDRTRFTMEESLSNAVTTTFVSLYNEGLIYKGARMINWDPAGKTALSDEEVIYKESDALLFYVSYAIENSSETITIATTRPETIMGDTAICVHPNDERYAHLVGKNAIVPLVNRAVPIIADEYVEMEFGTGALKVTPAHDINDYNLGQKHNLASIDIFNEDGTLSQEAIVFVGLDRFVARKKTVAALEEANQLVKKEAIKNKIGLSERTQAVIEPRISTQWFVNMTEFIAKNPEVLDNVMNDEIQLYPSKFKNTYRHWIENIKDWCISRQLWWGHRIPAWYTPEGNIIVAENIESALLKAQIQNPKLQLSDLSQEEDVLDTWFSSWLWPISVFDGFEEKGQKELDYYYPTNDLVTGPDILFFWVARMVMAGYHFKNDKPFKNVYFTGIVRDKQRRKMSKSLGNSPEPLDLMDQYGTDGVRLGLMLSAPAGNDILFDESLCEQGRNFCNKIWNAYRLLEGLETTLDADLYYTNNSEAIQQWMDARISETINSVDVHMDNYRISDALMMIYKLVWDDFCSNYLEMIKPPYGEKIHAPVLVNAKATMEKLMIMLHPFIPFITEELWQNLTQNRNNSFINLQEWPNANLSSRPSSFYESALQLVSTIRAIRNENGLSPKLKATVNINSSNTDAYKIFQGVIQKLGNIEWIKFNDELDGINYLIGTDEISVKIEGLEPKKADKVAVAAEINRLEQFVSGIEKKLDNEKFVANAHADVIEKERQKLADAKTKISTLKAELL
jgi:valyl-tRNA synthetase